MADIDRERRVTTVERDNTGVWIALAVALVVLLVLLFLWPGWLVGTGTDAPDTIDIQQEQQQPAPDQNGGDTNIIVPPSEETS